MDIARQVLPINIEKEMKQSYLEYAMSVIVARALPDVRDGLKPVQRRILLAMHDLNLGPSAQHRKSAKVCGDTSGNYHPHDADAGNAGQSTEGKCSHQGVSCQICGHYNRQSSLLCGDRKSVV